MPSEPRAPRTQKPPPPEPAPLTPRELAYLEARVAFFQKMNTDVCLGFSLICIVFAGFAQSAWLLILTPLFFLLLALFLARRAARKARISQWIVRESDWAGGAEWPKGWEDRIPKRRKILLRLASWEREGKCRLGPFVLGAGPDLTDHQLPSPPTYDWFFSLGVGVIMTVVFGGILLWASPTLVSPAILFHPRAPGSIDPLRIESLPDPSQFGELKGRYVHLALPVVQTAPMESRRSNSIRGSSTFLWDLTLADASRLVDSTALLSHVLSVPTLDSPRLYPQEDQELGQWLETLSKAYAPGRIDLFVETGLNSPDFLNPHDRPSLAHTYGRPSPCDSPCDLGAFLAERTHPLDLKGIVTDVRGDTLHISSSWLMKRSYTQYFVVWFILLYPTVVFGGILFQYFRRPKTQSA